MKKQCSKCLEWKELNKFGTHSTSKDGYRNQCKGCRKLYSLDYNLMNKERIKISKKEYYLKNIEDNKIYQKEYRSVNKEILLKNKKSYYLKNKERIINQKRIHNKNYILWGSIFSEQIKPYEEIRQDGEFLEIKCTYCGKWYKPTNKEVQSRLQSINGNFSTGSESRLYCSTNCKKECPIFNQKKYPRGYKKVTSREVQPELRQLVLERDDYTCQKCNLTQDELKVGLHCHHKEGIHWEPLLSADMDMCVTYCKTCHKEVHKIDGCKTSDMRC